LRAFPIPVTKPVRRLVDATRLGQFFDANALQTGDRWADDLVVAVGRSAVLALRTDRYATREWCLREVWEAKRLGRPAVMLDALTLGEPRGSFVLDQIPRVRVGYGPQGWDEASVMRGLSRLVDETLRRRLWERQLAKRDLPALGVDWAEPEAPEPPILALRLAEETIAAGAEPLRVLHPDPPLTKVELEQLDRLVQLAAGGRRLDATTPRGLFRRGADPEALP
jgi:hypothetical protein